MIAIFSICERFLCVCVCVCACRRVTMEAWVKLVELYGTDGPAIAVVS
jgi:hypothetical protein